MNLCARASRHWNDLRAVGRAQSKMHCFGYIHVANGMNIVRWKDNGIRREAMEAKRGIIICTQTRRDRIFANSLSKVSQPTVPLLLQSKISFGVP